MTKQERERLARLRSEANQPKSALLDILRNVEALSPTQGRQLASIIGRLEAWQNRGGHR
jgi:hypothetical protein